MTQVVSPETVSGRFEGQQLSFYGWKFKPERQGEDFCMEIRGSDDTLHFERKFVMTTGSHHMQKYWYSTGNTRELGMSPLVFLIEAGIWVPEQTAFLRPSKAGLPIREGDWNKGCNQCHATGSQPRLLGPNNIDTQVAEFGISCEACHGPGQQHVHARQQNEFAAENNPSTDSIVNPRTLSASKSADVCGQCHGAWVMKPGGHWSQTGHRFRPGDDLATTRHYLLGIQDKQRWKQVHAEDSFWSDGEIRVAGREYNGLLASPCFSKAKSDHQAMTCLSCHDLHAATTAPSKDWANDQLATGMNGNEACFQCHENYRNQLTDHTHHLPDSSGSLCYNCHMPHTSYGLLKAVRSHTITSPSIATSLATGRPNACNQCHLDQTSKWAAEQLNKWYGHEIPPLKQSEQVLAASVLWTLKGDAGQRALMAWSMGWDQARAISGSNWMIFYLADLMFDDYDAIRYIASRSLKQIPGYESLQYDHMHPNRQRDRVMNELISRWQATVTTPPPRSPRLLFDKSGTIRMDIFHQLRALRDHRDVVIIE